MRFITKLMIVIVIELLLLTFEMACIIYGVGRTDDDLYYIKRGDAASIWNAIFLCLFNFSSTLSSQFFVIVLFFQWWWKTESDSIVLTTKVTDILATPTDHSTLMTSSAAPNERFSFLDNNQGEQLLDKIDQRRNQAFGMQRTMKRISNSSGSNFLLGSNS